MNTGEFKGEIMLYACLFFLAINTIYSSEQKALIVPTEKEINKIKFCFNHSHQLTPAEGIDSIINAHVSDACNNIPTLGYMTKNSETTGTLQALVFDYYVEYQHYLLQPIRNPNNIFYKIYTWNRARKAENKLREHIALVHKSLITHKSLDDESEMTIAMIQHLTRELVEIERKNKKGVV